MKPRANKKSKNVYSTIQIAFKNFTVVQGLRFELFVELQKSSVLQSTELRSELFTTAQQWPPSTKNTKHRSTAVSSHETKTKRKVQISRREIKNPSNNVKKTSEN